MVKESVAILAVALLLAVAFLRTRHYGYTLAVVPVGVLPAVHLIFRLILYLTKGAFFGVRPAIVVAFADVLGLVLSCLAAVVIGLRIPSRRVRNLYLTVILVYTALLTWSFIYTTLQPLFA